MESNKEIPRQNITEPVVRMLTGTSNFENESFKSKPAIFEETKTSPHKIPLIPAPLNIEALDKK